MFSLAAAQSDCRVCHPVGQKVELWRFQWPLIKAGCDMTTTYDSHFESGRWNTCYSACCSCSQYARWTNKPKDGCRYHQMAKPSLRAQSVTISTIKSKGNRNRLNAEPNWRSHHLKLWEEKQSEQIYFSAMRVTQTEWPETIVLSFRFHQTKVSKAKSPAGNTVN